MSSISVISRTLRGVSFVWRPWSRPPILESATDHEYGRSHDRSFCRLAVVTRPVSAKGPRRRPVTALRILPLPGPFLHQAALDEMVDASRLDKFIRKSVYKQSCKYGNQVKRPRGRTKSS